MENTGVTAAKFFRAGNSERLAQELLQLPTTPSSRTALLSGPPRSGRTSLLFSLALNLAGEGRRVLVVSPHRAMKHPPMLPEGVSISSPEYRQIDIRYLENSEELRLYFASFHLLPSMPHAVILDDFSDFFPSSRFHGDRRALEIALAKTLALIYNATEHASERLAPAECKLVVADVTEDSGVPRSMFIFQRWLPLIFHLSVASAGSYQLKICNTDAVQDINEISIQYCLAHSHLVLERIERGAASDNHQNRDNRQEL